MTLNARVGSNTEHFTLWRGVVGSRYTRRVPHVHPTSMIGDDGGIDPSASVGPFCVLEGAVRLGPGVRLLGHNWIRGPVEIGAGTTIYPFATVGLPPQHTGRDHEAPSAGVRIGAGVTLREQSSVHAAMNETEPTRIGDGCYLMNSAHVGHDCRLGERVIVASGSVIGGHVEIGSGAFISGLVAIHQRVRIGRGAMTTGSVAFSIDLPPFCVAVDRNVMTGINRVGMRRAGIPRAEITAACAAFRRAFRTPRTRDDMLDVLDEIGARSACVREMADFVRETKRGIMAGDGRPRAHVVAWLRKRFMVLPDAAHGVDGAAEAEMERVD